MSNSIPPTLLSDEALRDPYPIYRRMREHGPIYRDELADAWCILDFELVKAVLDDPTGFSSKHLTDRAEPVLGARVLAQMTGAEHDAKKAATMRGLAEVAMDGYYLPTIENTVLSLWKKVSTHRTINLVEELAEPFSTEVTCVLLGVEHGWKEKILPWNRSIVQFITLLNQAPSQRSQRLADAGFFRAYMRQLIEVRRRSPQHDLVTYLAQHGADSGLTDDEIVALALNIFLAAAEPLGKTLSYLIYEVLRSPELLDSVNHNPALIPSYIAETLRLHPPVQIIPRITTAEQHLAGQRIPEESTVYCLIGAAHRDPSHFSDPDSFLPDRLENVLKKAFSPSAEHLSFGSGLHFCIGAMLAKRQIEAAFRSSLPYLSEWQLAPDPLVEHGLYTRGPSRLILTKER